MGGRGRTRGQKGETDLNGRINARSLAGFFLLFFFLLYHRGTNPRSTLSLSTSLFPLCISLVGHLVDLLPVKRRAKYPLLLRIIFRDVYRDYPIVKRPYTRNIIHAYTRHVSSSSFFFFPVRSLF